MIKSFFFIPGNHSKLTDKVLTLNADYFVIDLEDAIDESELEESLANLKKIADVENIYVRPNLFLNEGFNKELFLELLFIGIKGFVIPKFKTLEELQIIEKLILKNSEINCSFILLVENPRSLFFLSEILKLTKLNVVGIAFGSHDYCAETGMKHVSKLLEYPRFIVAGLAKAFGIYSIDIACMSIKDLDIFKKELEDSNMMGYDAKFVIHPKQLNVLNDYQDQDEIEEARQILAEYESQGKPQIFVYKGRVIEHPHIKKYKKTLNKS